jgi:hypothetical protein
MPDGHNAQALPEAGIDNAASAPKDTVQTPRFSDFATQQEFRDYINA